MMQNFPYQTWFHNQHNPENKEFKVCEYCKTYNEYGKPSCVACGAPLDYGANTKLRHWDIEGNSSAMPDMMEWRIC